MNLMDYLNSATSSLFRWEKLQEYADDAVALEKFRANGEIDVSDMNNWWKFLSDKRGAGVILQRVRLVVEPVNDYTKMEVAIHQESIKHGDDIRILDESAYSKIGIDLSDFWMIDDKTILIMKYGIDGKYEGFKTLPATPEYISFKEKVLSLSKSL
jgi:hypothetical protein